MTEAEIRALLPRHKGDCERAQAIIALGYPAVAPVLRDLLEWLQDCNWPVSNSIAPFLASLGEPVVPLIREVLQGNDDIWKYWCIDRIVLKLPGAIAAQLRPELHRLAFNPTKGEREQEVDERARAVLEWLDHEVPKLQMG